MRGSSIADMEDITTDKERGYGKSTWEGRLLVVSFHSFIHDYDSKAILHGNRQIILKEENVDFHAKT